MLSVEENLQWNIADETAGDRPQKHPKTRHEAKGRKKHKGSHRVISALRVTIAITNKHTQLKL